MGAILRSRPVFNRLWFFSPAPTPAPAPIKTTGSLSTIKIFFYNIPSSLLEKRWSRSREPDHHTGSGSDQNVLAPEPWMSVTAYPFLQRWGRTWPCQRCTPPWWAAGRRWRHSPGPGCSPPTVSRRRWIAAPPGTAIGGYRLDYSAEYSR